MYLGKKKVLFSMHILITGAGGALGQVVLQETLQKGHEVVALSRQPIALQHPRLKTIEIDLTDASSPIWSTLPAFDAAFLLAGGYTYGDLAQSTPHTLQEMFTMNFLTAFCTVKAIFPLMEARKKGHIVFISAQTTQQPAQGAQSLSYALSKSLLTPFADILEASSAGIKASVLFPSIIDTPANRQAMPKASPSEWVSPKEIAHALLTLVSDENACWQGNRLVLSPIGEKKP